MPEWTATKNEIDADQKALDDATAEGRDAYFKLQAAKQSLASATQALAADQSAEQDAGSELSDVNGAIVDDMATMQSIESTIDMNSQTLDNSFSGP